MVVDPLFFPPNRMKLKHPKPGTHGKTLLHNRVHTPVYKGFTHVRDTGTTPKTSPPHRVRENERENKK